VTFAVVHFCNTAKRSFRLKKLGLTSYSYWITEQEQKEQSIRTRKELYRATPNIHKCELDVCPHREQPVASIQIVLVTRYADRRQPGGTIGQDFEFQALPPLAGNFPDWGCEWVRSTHSHPQIWVSIPLKTGEK
jgi:hypothetical protein